jgi:hypothetical protein
LDQIKETLGPVITNWTQNAASRLEHGSTNCAVHGGTDQGWSATILRQLLQQGGLGSKALCLLDPELACKPSDAPPLSDPSGGTSRWSDKSPFLYDWTRNAWTSVHDHFLLLGILFGPRSFLSRLAPISGDRTQFSAACRSLVDLNCLEPFDRSLHREVAQCLLNIETPQSSSSCVAWAVALGMSLQGLSAATDSNPDEEACMDQEILGKASNELMNAIRWAADREGWKPFIHEALRALNIVYASPDFAAASGSNFEGLRKLAESVKAQLNDEVQAHKQADKLLLSLSH